MKLMMVSLGRFLRLTQVDLTSPTGALIFVFIMYRQLDECRTDCVCVCVVNEFVLERLSLTEKSKMLTGCSGEAPVIHRTAVQGPFRLFQASGSCLPVALVFLERPEHLSLGTVFCVFTSRCSRFEYSG